MSRDRNFLVILHYWQTGTVLLLVTGKALIFSLSLKSTMSIQVTCMSARSFVVFYHRVLYSSCLFWKISGISFTMEQFEK